MTKTALYPATRDKVKKIYEKINREKLTPWAFFNVKLAVEGAANLCNMCVE